MCLKTYAIGFSRLLYRDAKTTLHPYLFHPGEAFGFLALTAVLAVFPHRANNTFRKLITFILILTWVIVTTAIAFDAASVNPYIWGTFTGLTMLVWGQMWELEKYRVSIGPLELVHQNDNDN